MEAEYSAARLEQLLAQIWEHTLAVATIDVGADLFGELGATSADALRAVGMVQREIGVRITPEILFETPTIAGQALVLRRIAVHAQGATDDLGDHIELRRSGVTSCLATQIQRVFWHMERADLDGPGFNGDSEIELEGMLDRPALERALAMVVAAHSIVRTTYREVAGELHQFVKSPDELPIPLEFEDLTSIPEEQRDQAKCEWVDRYLRQRFDLVAGPCLRVALLRLAPQRHVLVVSMHHIGGDAHAWSVLHDHLGGAYAALAERTGTGSIEPRFQYIDFADHMVRHHASPEGKSQSEYWSKQLTGAPALELPNDLPRDAIDRQRDAAPLGIICLPTHVLRTSITGTELERVRCIARDERTSDFVVLLAAVAALVHERTAQNDISLLSVHSLRHNPDLHDVIGCAFSPLIMRIDASGRPTFRELVQRVKATVMDAYANGAGQVVDRGGHGVRRLHVNYVPAAQAAPERAEFGAGLLARRTLHTLQYKTPGDISFNIVDRKHKLDLMLRAATDLFRRETGEQLLSRYCALLTAAASDPSLTV